MISKPPTIEDVYEFDYFMSTPGVREGIIQRQMDGDPSLLVEETDDGPGLYYQTPYGEQFPLGRVQPPAMEGPGLDGIQLAMGGSGAGRGRANAPTMTDAGMGLMDMLAGALRGTVAQTIGLPGDVESLVRMLSNTESGQVLPTTDRMNQILPPVVPPNAPNAKQRQHTARISNTLGEFNPASPAVVAPVAKAATKATMAVGRAGERLAERTVPQIMEKGGTLAELMQAMSQGSRSQLTAYHGTPHRIDKFDSGKIGTGEGNQSYGYGLYFAESPDVAKTYMEVNPSVLPAPIRTFKGAELKPGSPEYHAASLLDSMTLPQARKAVAGWIKEADPRMAREAEGWAKTLETLNAAQSKSDFKQLKNKGALYTVDIPDEMVGKMLEWDKPLKEQPENVRAFFADVPSPPNDDTIMGPWLQKRFGNGADVYWAQDMQKAGVPGIRYLDAGSRGASSGTRNLVIFPGGEDQIKIVKTERKK